MGMFMDVRCFVVPKRFELLRLGEIQFPAGSFGLPHHFQFDRVSRRRAPLASTFPLISILFRRRARCCSSTTENDGDRRERQRPGERVQYLGYYLGYVSHYK